MKLLLVGRSAHADVVIADDSVAAYHAEIVMTAQGRIHITDRASTKGTFRRAASEESWTPLRQAFVEESDELRLGDYACRVSELLAAAPGAATEEAGAPGSGWPPAAGDAAGRPRGAVERDPVTGEIVRRRL